jgi:hypothetical protein
LNVKHPPPLPFQKGTYCTGMKLFGNLPSTIKSLNHDAKIFRPPLKGYLSYSFSVEKFTVIKVS